LLRGAAAGILDLAGIFRFMRIFVFGCSPTRRDNRDNGHRKLAAGFKHSVGL
jgi:hypothetical protein